MDSGHGELHVSWRAGTWLVGPEGDQSPLPGDGAALDQWLADRGVGRTDLDFGGSRALEQKFIFDFGPLDPAQRRR